MVFINNFIFRISHKFEPLPPYQNILSSVIKRNPIPDGAFQYPSHAATASSPKMKAQ